MRRIRNLQRVTVVVIALTLSVAIGASAWRAYFGKLSGNEKESHEHSGQAIETQAGPSHERHEH